MTTPLLLFSDVDGTLLDRDGHYAMSADELAPFTRSLLIVLASSRTVLELSRNQRALGITGPVVAENGAVIAFPWHELHACCGSRDQIDGRLWCVITLGVTAASIRAAILREAAQLGLDFVDQLDVDPALDRRASVCLRPGYGASTSTLAPLAARLATLGYTAASGGDWLAVTQHADKGRGARAVLTELAERGETPLVVGAVGDGDNDVPLLCAADQRYVIARDNGTWHDALRVVPNVTCMARHGIAGWRDVVTNFVTFSEPA